jgi:hypothetical protein
MNTTIGSTWAEMICGPVDGLTGRIPLGADGLPAQQALSLTFPDGSTSLYVWRGVRESGGHRYVFGIRTT